MITGIVGGVIVVWVISIVKLDGKCEIGVVILGCYGIGMGAGLSGIGEGL
ncbi:DUF1646 family protein [Virgibacillus sp. SK37]|nr:DUF1646 family protein [Virgibacillus sp. SK37]